MSYLIWQQDNGNFVGIASCDIDKHKKLERPNVWDFHWDKDAKSVADFIFKYFAKPINEVRLVDKDTNKTIKTFYRQ